LDIAKNTIAHLDKFTEKLHYCPSAEPNPDIDQLVYDLKHKFTRSMNDDFNVAPALAALFEFTRRTNPLMDRKGLSPADRQKVDEVLKSINSVLGVMDLEPPERDQKVEVFIKKREEARKEKDWDTADRIRQELKEMGIEVIDMRDGPIWRKK
jgi:cysteinyl-tRNA synthetase